MSVTWAGNAVRIDNLSYHWAIEDIGGDAAVVLGGRLEHPAVDAAAVPVSLKKALPREAGLGIRYSGFKLSAMWEALSDPQMTRQALTTKDFHTDRILPEGKVRMDFDDTYFRSEHYDVTISGGMDMPVKDGGRPYSADISVTAKNFDKTIKFLQDLAREDPGFGQISFTAMMMKGLGKAQPDGSVTWHVESDASGKVKVNGQPMPGR